MNQRKLNFMPIRATFELGEKLGMGTVGIVYRATSPDVEGEVALKLLNPTVSDDEAIVNRFEREIVVMERFSHPHIVRTFGGGQMEGQLFYVMELLEYGSVKDRLQRGPLAWAQVAAYGGQIASALQHAHNEGVIHRDLKPSNLFFNQAGNLVLGDFGIAHDMNAQRDITQQGMTVGTFSYMSPEQITADSRLSGSADLYSLGCVLFEMLTGRPPYVGQNFAQVWEQHLHKTPPSVRQAQRDTGHRADCPEWLDQLIQQLLAKKPEERPFNARAVEGVILQHLFDEFGREKADQLTRIDTKHQLGPPKHAQPRTWTMWVMLAAIAVGLVWIVASR